MGSSVYMKRAIFLGLLALQGCVSVPQKKIDDRVASSLSFDASSERALASGVFQEGEWPTKNWWELFHDPQLASFIRTALADSPTMKRAEARMRAARQAANEKRAALFPHLDFDADTNWQYLSKNGFFRSIDPTIPGNINVIDVSLDFTYELDFFGKNRHTFEAAFGIAKAEEAERAQTILILSTAVASVYFELQADLSALHLLKEIGERRSILSQLHRERYTYGLDTEIRNLKFERDVLNIQNLILSIEKKIELDSHLLRMLMGHNPDDGEKLMVVPSEMRGAFPLPCDLSADLLARRPDLMAQIWRVEAAAHEIGAARALFYPNVNLLAFAGFESVSFSNIFSWQSRMAALNPAINLPIFTAGKLTANLKGKKAKFDEAIASYHELLLQAAKEVVDQISLFRLVSDQLKIQRLTIDNVEKNYQLTSERFSVGVDRYTNVLDTEEQLLEQKLEWIKLEYERYLSAVRLIKALGGGYHTKPPLGNSGGKDG